MSDNLDQGDFQEKFSPSGITAEVAFGDLQRAFEFFYDLQEYKKTEEKISGDEAMRSARADILCSIWDVHFGKKGEETHKIVQIWAIALNIGATAEDLWEYIDKSEDINPTAYLKKTKGADQINSAEDDVKKSTGGILGIFW